MVMQDLEYRFATLDIECKGYIEWIELQEFDEEIYQDESLDIEQLEAAIETVCGPNSNGKCPKEYFPDVAKELERRHVMVEKIRWDFRALDPRNVGRLSLETTLLLFKVIHNDRFSDSYWQSFLNQRKNRDADVCLDDVSLYLCNIPEYIDATQSDNEYLKNEEILKDKSLTRNYDAFRQLNSLQETEEYLAEVEKEKVNQANRLKRNASNLLNRMEEIGIHALLEDDFGDAQNYSGRPKDKLTATELLDALKDKYDVLRDLLLLQMLRSHIGEGMWQALSERECQEKLFQLKIKEEKLRKEGKLETMAIHLPGSRVSVNYNVFHLMGESIPELEQRILDQQEKIRESGLSMEEVVREFGKKLNDKEKLNSSGKDLLLDLNKRYLFEKDILTKRLQGLSGFQTLTASDREKIMFSFVQAILRGTQEKSFVSCAYCMGLCERVQPRNHDRSVKDPEKQTKLSSFRNEFFKNRRSLDGPALPPRLHDLKPKLGRLDIVLQLVQELEHRLSLEREFLMTLMNSKEVLQNRATVRKLPNSEREKQLSVLLAQWQSWRNKPPPEKLHLQSQIKICVQEATALKFESIKDDMKDEPNSVVSDLDASTSLLSSLQMKQDERCQKLLNVNLMTATELEDQWIEQKAAIEEQWNDNVATIIFGIIEVSEEESELLDALQNKYDALKDKLLMQSLMDQYGKTEWDKLSEKERQKRLMELKLQEKKLRKEGKFDEISKLFGDSANNADILSQQLGLSREKYMEQLNERLRNRQRKIDAGEDPDDLEEDMMDEMPHRSSGNLLKDLDQRFDEEKDALLKKLREGNDRKEQERERQSELMRLRLEARKAGREANFDSAALVLGLAERNNASLEDHLKGDRKRQEQLAKERLEARRQRKKDNQVMEEDIDKVEPQKNDVSGWKDLALKELARTHEKEYNILSDFLQDQDSEDLRREARELSHDDRQERLNNLREKRSMLDFSIKTDQEEHMSIMEMAASVKYVIWDEMLRSAGDEIDSDQVIISAMANLQEIQDKETKEAMEMLPNISQEEVINFRNKQVQYQNEVRIENVSQIVFKYEGSVAKDEEFVKVLDKKYDALLDKLALEALEKQMGEAEWKKLSEQERQAQAMKLKLQQKRLMKEGKLDEAARLLGEGFECEANVKKLMGESRKRYNELLKERLEERKKRIANGESLSDMDEESAFVEEFADSEKPEEYLMETTSAKSLLAGLQERYDEEKDALLSRLRGADTKFMNEKERQAELTRLKREQRRAQKEGRFDTAAMMLGLAERNKAEADAKLSNDRARQEAIAKSRLEMLRNKKASKAAMGTSSEDGGPEEEESDESEDEPDIYEALMKLIERRQAMEQEELVQCCQSVKQDSMEKALLMTRDVRNNQLSSLKASLKHTEDLEAAYSEIAAIKMVNRREVLQSADSGEITNDSLIISLMADLQQKQNEEDEEIIKALKSTPEDEIPAFRNEELQNISLKMFPQLAAVLCAPDETKSADEDVLVSALETKYDVLKDKLILDALEKQMGEAKWSEMNEKERQQELTRIKLEQKKLQKEGKLDEASKILNELLQNDTNVQALLGSSKAEQENRLKERLAKRKMLRAAGMNDEEIKVQEDQEDKDFEVEVAKRTAGNTLVDLEKNFELEKNALMDSLKNADSKLANERQRQLQLARLRRETKKIQAEEKFGAAAMVMGVARSQQAAVEARMKSDRSRQLKLAKERLEARKNRRLSSQKEEEEEVSEDKESSNTLVLHGSLLNILERIHSSERNFLMELIQEENKDFHDKASLLPNKERQKRLFVLNELRKNWRESPETPEDQITMFREAIWLKVKEIGCSFDIKDEDVTVRLLADLQDLQDREATLAMQDLAEKDSDTLKKLIEINENALNQKLFDNLAQVLLDTNDIESIFEESSVEDELTDALKQKYDALKEKVFVEAVKGKFDEETWNSMTEKEKEEHIANMKADEHFRTNEDNLDGVMLPSLEMSDNEVNEASKVTGTNILKDLEKQFEAEKEALLSSLRDADKRQVSERERQLKLALLRRDKKRIKQAEKYDSAAVLFNMAKENDSQREKSYENERSRQVQIARERIAARQRKKKETVESQGTSAEVEAASGKVSAAESEIEKLKEEEDNNMKQDLEVVEKIQREGTIALRESVLMEMEEKHFAEQDKLYELIQLIGPDELVQTSKLEPDEQNTKLNLISLSQKKLREQSRSFIESHVVETMGAEEKRNFNKLVSKGRAALSGVIKDGLVVALVIKSSNLGKSISSGEIDEEISVSLLADLQELQSMENHALEKALVDCDRNMVQRLKEEQRKSRLAGYLDNLAAVLFKDINKTIKEKMAEEAAMKKMEEEVKKIESDGAELLEQLEKEIEEKKQKMLPTMTGEDMDKFINELQRQEEAKRKAIRDQVAKQQALAKQKLLEKMKKRDEKLQESQFVNSMIKDAQKRSELIREKTLAVQGSQRDVLADRLQRRRESRTRKQLEKEELEKLAAMAEKNKPGETEQHEEMKIAEERKKEGTEPETDKEQVVKKKKVMPPLPGGGMKREKTVVEKAADISENKKQEMINMLMREQTSLALKISSEQSRQEEQVRALREKRRKKMEARETEAAAVLGLGQRQKTIVEERNKGERARQIGQIRDRVNRIKEERNSAKLNKREEPDKIVEEGEQGTSNTLHEEGELETSNTSQ